MFKPDKLHSNSPSPSVPTSPNISDGQQQGVAIPPNHDITLALLSAIMFPGVGQFYNGQTAKAALLISSSALGLAALLLHLSNVFMVALLVCGFLVWLLAIVDASVIASRLIRRETVRAWQWF